MANLILLKLQTAQRQTFGDPLWGKKCVSLKTFENFTEAIVIKSSSTQTVIELCHVFR